MRKVLIIDLHCDSLLPAGVGEFGGGNTYSKAVVSTIMNTDVEFMYITRKKIPTLPDTEKIAPNIKYIRIHISQEEIEDKDTLFLYTDEIIEQILVLLQRHQFIPDLIHSIYWPCGIIAQKLSLHLEIPMIHTVLSNGKRKKIQSGHYKIAEKRISAEKSCFDCAQYIICSSNYELHDIENLYHIPKSKLVLTGLDVDSAFKIPAYNRSGSYQLNKLISGNSQYISIDKASHSNVSLWWNGGAFLYYGRLHSDKGICEIVVCWLELKLQYPDFPPLWIAGGSPEQIYKLRKKIGFEKQLLYFESTYNLIWWGRLTPDGLSTLMLKTLALVSHSRYESGGLMVLEAMAHKIPVIATPHGYAKDYISDWENGFLIPFADRKLLKKRLLHFYKQPFLSSVLGEKAGMLYKNINNYFQFSEKHMSLYRTGKLSFFADKLTTTIFEEALPYPITNTLPSDNEVLSFFTTFIQQLHWDYNSLPILCKTNNTPQYCQWIIEWNCCFYECFIWKSFVNIEKVFFEKEPSFYIQGNLFATDKILSNNYCLNPLNSLENCQISIYQVEERNISWHELQESLEKLFNTPKECFQNLPLINFKLFAEESLKALEDYFYSDCNFLNQVYLHLQKAKLLEEPIGIIPLFLLDQTIIDNQFRHIGQLAYGAKSYFYAQYILLYQDNCFEHQITNTAIYKNIIYWILNFHFRNAVRELIKHNFISTSIKNQIQKLIALLK